MGSLNPGDESKQELNDSGYVQDGSLKIRLTQDCGGRHKLQEAYIQQWIKLAVVDDDNSKESKPAEYRGTAQLLDLSDDVLLYIFRNCTPQELKALGFTCPRLGSLVLDRTLWVDVDTAGVAHGRRRVRWLLSQALGPHTKRLRLCGYAKQAEGCLGFMNRYDLESDGSPDSPDEDRPDPCTPRVYRLAQSLPRYGGGFPYWPSQGAAKPHSPDAAEGCPGPQLTLTHTGLRELVSLCTGLRTLELEDCVIDCQTTNIGMFPKTLTKLSLKGTKCFNLESKSFLFKIQDHLTHLEELDVSFCTWIEPACMLPLSKMPCLKALAMRECHKLAEFVAYASLATRYGFKKLKYLDLRGSPVGDSEVSALGWLPQLEELHLAPAPKQTGVREHAHYSQDIVASHVELEEWEEMEPDYFKPPDIPDEEWLRDEDDVHGNRTRYYTTNTDDPSARLAEAERALTSILGLSLNEVEAYVRRRQDHEAQREPPRPPAACILLERMIAEPVAPEEYAQVYHQFLAGHNSNIPLANPEEYREAYRQYMSRPHHGRPPAGYSLFIRKPAERRRDSGKRRRDHLALPPCASSQNNPKASTSDSNKNKSDDATPGPSNSRPKPDPPKNRDSDDSSDDDSPSPKRAAIPQKPPTSAKKDANGGKKSTKKDDKREARSTRRVFEITINELNTHVHELIDPNDMNVDGNEANVAGNEANVAGNDVNVGGNEANVSGNEANVEMKVDDNEMNAGGNEANVGGNDMNVDGNEMKVDGNEMHVDGNEANVGGNAMKGDVNEINVGGNEMHVANDGVRVESKENQPNDNGNSDGKDKKDGDKVNAGGNNNAGVNANAGSSNMGGNPNTGVKNANPGVNPNEGVNYNAANERGNANADRGDANAIIASYIINRQIEVISPSGDANGGGNANPGANNTNGEDNTSGGSNANSRERGDGLEEGDANKGGNDNAKGSVNVGGNANVDVNANVRGNFSAEGSVNVGGNSNADVNDNENVNANVRGKANADVDANQRGNDNADVDANQRDNANAEGDSNVSGNSNAEGGSNDKGNANADNNANARGKVNVRRNSNAGNRPSMINYAAINPPPNELLNPITRQRLLQFRTYRRPIVIEEFINECEEQDGPRRLPQRVLFSGLPGSTARLDHTALVSDSSIRRFGRAIGENIAYIHIGGGPAGSARPDRSSLRVLSVSGYRHVTDASLTHLATAAPRLRALDVRRTAVTPRALAAFRALRPDVDVRADTDETDIPFNNRRYILTV